MWQCWQRTAHNGTTDSANTEMGLRWRRGRGGGGGAAMKYGVY